MWNKLPDTVAVHFNFYSEADNFASKGFAVFGLPILMAFLQIFCCVTNDINAHKHGSHIKFEKVAKWIIPVMTIILQSVLLGYALGLNIDMRKIVALIIGTLFLVLGNYMPEFDNIKNVGVDTEKARKINSFIGYEMVSMGILMLVTIFLPPIATIIWLLLLIPCTIISVIYGIKVGRNK